MTHPSLAGLPIGGGALDQLNKAQAWRWIFCLLTPILVQLGAQFAFKARGISQCGGKRLHLGGCLQPLSGKSDEQCAVAGTADTASPIEAVRGKFAILGCSGHDRTLLPVRRELVLVTNANRPDE